MILATPATFFVLRLRDLVGDAAGGYILFGRTAATVRSLGRCDWTAAHARLRQSQLDALGRFAVACDIGDDRAHLLIASQHQECWGAAVGFHARELVAGLGLGEFACAMRSHRAAAMFVRVDERGEQGRAFKRRIERDAQLPQK